MAQCVLGLRRSLAEIVVKNGKGGHISAKIKSEEELIPVCNRQARVSSSDLTLRWTECSRLRDVGEPMLY